MVTSVRLRSAARQLFANMTSSSTVHESTDAVRGIVMKNTTTLHKREGRQQK